MSLLWKRIFGQASEGLKILWPWLKVLVQTLKEILFIDERFLPMPLKPCSRQIQHFTNLFMSVTAQTRNICYCLKGSCGNEKAMLKLSNECY